MTQSLLIVESPTKVKTLKKYLGADFDVRASMGHVKDLPPKELGIDVDNNFAPTYAVIEGKKKTMSELKRAAKQAERIYLAPDPDREGEAIAWHIAEEIGVGKRTVFRVLFNDLTQQTIRQAVDHPQELDLNKYEAQQTRRILDRLVGYQISPLLWDKVKRGLSAGRVQSVAVRMICDREEEIRRFVAEEYWTITAQLEGSLPPLFEARLIKTDGKKSRVGQEVQANEVVTELEKADFRVAAIEKKEVKRNPLPPFTTSKLQQEASRWLHFSAKKTMSVAQQLYEGVELGAEGPVGLITYMRTDSVRIAEEAIRQVREYIREQYEPSFLPAKPRFFKNAGSAQDAHEAIRPTTMAYPPQSIRAYLSNDQFRLYQLIWNRFTASQMSPAISDQTIIDIQAGRHLLRAQGSVMKFPGFTVLYTESKKENGNGNDSEASGESDFGKVLPALQEKEALKLLALKPEQKFTQPPLRFSEASLVRELEERGIGRPSTYANTLSTIQDRKYAELEKGKFHPTDLGTLVTELLVKNFPKILDIDFTAAMETQLDRIAEGALKRLELLTDFYGSFAGDLKQAKANMRQVKGKGEPTDQVCEKCSAPMVIKWGRNGRFIACSNYPTCRNTRNLQDDGPGAAAEAKDPTTDIPCDTCGKPMAVKQGRFGRFLGCTGYPDCKNTQPISMGVSCPETDCPGYLVEKKSKKGKTFFSCSQYPRCTFATWNRPVAESCPQCGAPFLVEKIRRNGASFKTCFRENCAYSTEKG